MTTLLILLVKWTTADAGTAGISGLPLAAGTAAVAALTDFKPIKTVTVEISYTDNLY